jgi:hypothetical protein
MDEVDVVKAKLKKEYTLYLANAKEFYNHYGVLISFIEDDKKTQVKFTSTIKYLTTLENENRVFEVDRTSAVYINDIEPDNTLDELAHECGSVYYPLQLEIGVTGKILSIYNYAEIIDRWQKKKQKLKEYFQGEIVEQYIQLMNETIQSENELTDCITKDLFFDVYFSSIYKMYTTGIAFKTDNYFPLIGKSFPIKFSCIEVLGEYVNDYGAIELSHSGVLSDDRCILDLEEELDYPVNNMLNTNTIIEKAKGAYDGLYILNHNSGEIETIIANWKIDLTIKKEIEIKVYKIENNFADESDADIVENQKAISNKGFFGKLFTKKT